MARHIVTKADTVSIYEVESSPCVIPAAMALDISELPINTGFEGFGVALTDSSCYNLMQMDDIKRFDLLYEVFSKMHLSFVRISIGSSDYSTRLYSYCDKRDTSLSSFSIEKDEAYVIPVLKEILRIRPDIFIFASPWSPPAWMKTGKSLCGGYMKNEYVATYAEYIVKFIEAYKAHGIKISAVTPQNEPETQQNGLMPACLWHPDTEAAFIKVLGLKLKETGLNTKIWAYDHNFSGACRVDSMLEDDDVVSALQGIAFHYYSGHVEDTAYLKNKYGLALHFTEGGPRLFDNYATDVIKWTLMIIKSLEAGYSSFTGWNLMLDENGKPNIGPFSCGGLITRNSVTGELSFSGQYRAFDHVAKYVAKDSKIYSLSSRVADNMFAFKTRSLPLTGIFIKNEAHNVAVIINDSNEIRFIEITDNGKIFCFELPAQSVSTIEF